MEGTASVHNWFKTVLFKHINEQNWWRYPGLIFLIKSETARCWSKYSYLKIKLLPYIIYIFATHCLITCLSISTFNMFQENSFSHFLQYEINKTCDPGKTKYKTNQGLSTGSRLSFSTTKISLIFSRLIKTDFAFFKLSWIIIL